MNDEPHHEQTVGTFIATLDKTGLRERLANLLPSSISVDRFMDVVKIAQAAQPDLAGCTARSFYSEVQKCAKDGLVPDGREAVLLPFNVKVGKPPHERWEKRVVYVPMIFGIRKVVRQSGEVLEWNCQVVHSRDQFEYELGDDPYIKHRPSLEKDPGPVIAAYSVATLPNGEKSREIMSIWQIEKHRAMSKQPNGGLWTFHFDEACRKTVGRVHSKILPMAPEQRRVVERDDEHVNLQAPVARPQLKDFRPPQEQLLPPAPEPEPDPPKPEGLSGNDPEPQKRPKKARGAPKAQEAAQEPPEAETAPDPAIAPPDGGIQAGPSVPAGLNEAQRDAFLGGWEACSKGLPLLAPPLSLTDDLMKVWQSGWKTRDQAR